MQSEGPNAEQIKQWNEVSGPTWVAQHDLISEQLRPLGELTMERAGIGPGDRVLDVGCGCGETTMAIARRVGPSGSAVGVDISAPMLERAREASRAAGIENARFELADAQTAALPEQSFDRLYSRFGVMFFGDPVAAFTNLRRALRSGAGLTFICWRAPIENPWFVIPAVAVMHHVTVTPPEPSGPGPFAFVDKEKVEGILTQAGFNAITIEPLDMPLAVAGASADLDTAVALSLKMGLARSALQGASDEIRAAAARSVKAALEPYVTSEGVRLRSACWIVTAKAP